MAYPQCSKASEVVEATKFFVADATNASTYEYGPSGQQLSNNKVNVTDTNPRGIATIAAGNKVWTIDSNRYVYAYDQDGKLLGSWTAGGLTTPEDITTDGTDIWIVDAGAKKVFRYTGAASRLSGTQNPASSFALNSLNTKPTGLVTDGSSIWVVDNSTTAGGDKVFKYNLTGTGTAVYWTIDSRNADPTGITITPGAANDIWIVDSTTDAIYRYNAAASRTSGSQTAAAVFRLATSNTNPQGIADPPAQFVSEIADTSAKAASLATPTAGTVDYGKKRGVQLQWDGFATVVASASNTRSTTLFERSLGRSLVAENVELPDSPIINNRNFDSLDDAFGLAFIGSDDGYAEKLRAYGIENETLDCIADDYVVQLSST